MNSSSGLLALHFAEHGGISRLLKRRQRFPLRFTVPLYLDPAAPGMAFVYVQNPTGGVFAGDVLTTDITTDEGTTVHVTTPAATKIYRGDGTVARCNYVFRLGAGSYVEHVPEPLIPYAGSRYVQDLRIKLGPGSAFVGVDSVAPGRFARGEAFEFDLVEMRTTAYAADGSELCVDRLVLEPARTRPLRRGMLGDRAYFATILVLAPGRAVDAIAATVDDAVRDMGAAALLPNGAGALARVLAPSSVELRGAVEAGWAAARRMLIGCEPPPRRK